MTEGCQGCIFFYNSRPRVAETKLVKGKEGQGEGKREQEGENKGRESKRLNLVIFLICAFLFALSVHAGVLTKQSVK